MTEDQKKYLVLGTVGGAFALFFGSLIFGDSKAAASPMTGPPGSPGTPARHHHQHGGQRAMRRQDDEGDGWSRDNEHDDQENGRGEYGRKKHHHKGHRHEH